MINIMTQLKCCITLDENNKCINKRLSCNDKFFKNAVSKCISNKTMIEELFGENNIYVCNKHLNWRLEEMIRNRHVDTLIDYAAAKRCDTCNIFKLEIDFFNTEYNTCKKCCNKIVIEIDKNIYRKMNVIRKCAVDMCKNKAISTNAPIKNNTTVISYYDFCLKHQLEGWQKELFQNGRKPCNRINDGCRNTLFFKDKKKKCDDCTIVEQIKNNLLQCEQCNSIVDANNELTICDSCELFNSGKIKINKMINESVVMMTYDEFLQFKKLHMNEKIIINTCCNNDNDNDNNNDDDNDKINNIINEDDIMNEIIENEIKQRLLHF